jgi:hypothetical protein
VPTRRLSTTLVSNQNVYSPAFVVGSGGAVATSVTIPTHRPGDLIVMFAKASAQNTQPAPPAASGTVPTWQLETQSVYSSAFLGMSGLYCCLATASNHTSGTWTNTTGMIVAVVRKAAGIGGAAGSTGQISSPWTAPAVNLFKSNTTSLILHFYSWGDATNTAPTISAAPSGYTRQFDTRTSLVGLALNTKNVTTTAPAIAQTTGSGSIWASHITVEVLAG